MPILVGCHEARRVAFEANMGHPCDTLRFFGSSETNFNGGKWAAARAGALLGYEVCVSFDISGTWPQIAGGSGDSRATQVRNWMLTVPPPPSPLASGKTSIGHQIVFQHEMDLDSQNAADFALACARVYTVIFGSGMPPGWVFAIIMTGGYRDHPWNDRDPDDYWPVTGPPVALLGADYYNQRGAKLPEVWADSPPNPHRNQADINTMLLKATSHGAKLMFPEYASSIQDPAIAPNDWTERRNWIQTGADMHRDNPNLYSITYYERDSQDGRVNWAIAGGTVPARPESGAAFYSWGTGSGAPVGLGAPARENDSAQPIRRVRRVHVGMASESDRALAATVFLDAPELVNLAAELDGALPMTPHKKSPWSVAVEATTLNSVFIRQLGIAGEADSAHRLPYRVRMPPAPELDGALPVTIRRKYPWSEAVQATTPRAVIPTKVVQIGIASEADLAQIAQLGAQGIVRNLAVVRGVGSRNFDGAGKATSWA